MFYDEIVCCTMFYFVLSLLFASLLRILSFVSIVWRYCTEAARNLISVNKVCSESLVVFELVQ